MSMNWAEDMNRMHISILGFAHYVFPLRDKSGLSTSIAFVVEAAAHTDKFQCQMYHQKDSPRRNKQNACF